MYPQAAVFTYGSPTCAGPCSPPPPSSRVCIHVRFFSLSGRGRPLPDLKCHVR